MSIKVNQTASAVRVERWQGDNHRLMYRASARAELRPDHVRNGSCYKIGLSWRALVDYAKRIHEAAAVAYIVSKAALRLSA